MATQLRAGILGGGFMAEVHTRAIRAAGHEVVMLASSSAKSSAKAAASLGISQTAESAFELIAASDVDVVHVCTPNTFHTEQASLALAAGKPVVCEKPLATTVAGASSLLEQAQAAGVETAVPFVYRFYPAVREIRERIARGDAGDLHLLHGSYLQDWLALSTATNWRVNEKVGGASRAFADIGVHWCDLMEFVTGHRITRLVASMARPHSGRGATEDAASILFETDRGASGTLIASQISYGRKNEIRFSFDGELESSYWNQEVPGRFTTANARRDAIVNVGSAEVASMAGQNVTYLPAGHPRGYQDAFDAFMADAYRSFKGEAVEGLPTFADGLRAATITEAVLLSESSRQWVDVAPVVPVSSAESAPSSQLTFTTK